MRFKKGMTVYHPQLHRGVVTATRDFIEVLFSTGITLYFRKDGRLKSTDAYPSISFTPWYRWISIDDVPMDNQSVIVCVGADGEVLDNHYFSSTGQRGTQDRKKGAFYAYTEQMFGIETEGVTHWMPLPHPPEANE